MKRSTWLLLSAALSALPGCGPLPPPAPEGAAPSEPAPSAPTQAPAATPPAEPAAKAPEEPPPGGPAEKSAGPPPQAAAPSEAETLARDFLKSGGRRIGYSASKKGFAYPHEQRSADGFRLDVQFLEEDGKKRDAMPICDFNECAEKLDEIAKTILPKLSSRLEAGGYVSVRGLGWPAGQSELEVGSLGMKLRYEKGRLSGLREGKPPLQLGSLGGSVPDAPELVAIFLVPDAKRLAAFGKPGKAAAKGVVQELHVFKLP